MKNVTLRVAADDLVFESKSTSRENNMAGLIGTLGKFDPKTETVTSYEERLKLYLVANNIAANDENAERRKAIFLSEVGKEIFQVLSDLFSPDKPADKTLAELLEKIKDHYEPVPVM